MKKKTIAASIMSLAICGSIVTGATFALFTSESKTNVAIQSGNVEVVATVEKGDDPWVYSPTTIAADASSIIDYTNAANVETGYFANEGYAVINDDGTVDLNQMTPGDKVSLNVKIDNNSDVTIKYHTVISASVTGEEDKYDLADVMNITVNDTDSYTGKEIKTTWLTALAGNDIEDIAIDIEMPIDTPNEYKGQSISFDIGVVAVQGNAETVDAPVAETAGTAADLKALIEDALLNVSAEGENIIQLTKDIEIENNEWEAMDLGGYNGVASVTIDGAGHTITGLNAPLVTGKFAGDGVWTFKDLTIDSANISGYVSETGMPYAVGAFLGYSDGSGPIVFNNCRLVNSTIQGSNNDVSGYTGGFIGYVSNAGSASLTFNNCSVTDTDLSGYKTIGAFFGYSSGTVTVKNANFADVNVSTNDDGGHKVGLVGGTFQSATENLLVNVKYSNCTLSQPNLTTGTSAKVGLEVLYGRKVASGTDTTIKYKATENEAGSLI